jgi:hypothetical protein
MAVVLVPIIVVFKYTSKYLSLTHEPTMGLTRLVLSEMNKMAVSVREWEGVVL